jgi:hypothetical protein
MQLPNLSGLSLRNNEAPTDGIFKDGTEPPPHPDPPASEEELLASIREKVRPLVYTDQMLYDLFKDDLALEKADDDHHSHNEIIPFGGKYILGVAQASYDYKIMSETKFKVRVHTTLLNSIGGRPIDTNTVEFEYEDTLYDEFVQLFDFFKALETLSKRDLTLKKQYSEIVTVLKTRLKPPPRPKGENEDMKDYGQDLMRLCFHQFERPLRYMYNGFREGEGVPITQQTYSEKVDKMLSKNREEARELDDMLKELYPDGEHVVPTIEFYALNKLNSMASSTKDYPFETLERKGPKGNLTRTFFKDTLYPRSFWLLFVLQAIEKSLVESLYSLLHFPPPPAEEPRGGPAYELWMDEANKLGGGSDSDSDSDSDEAGRE